MKNTLVFVQQKLSNINLTEHSVSCLFDATSIADRQCSLLAVKYLHANELVIFEQRKKLLAKKEYLASRYIIKTLITKLHGCLFEALDVAFDKNNHRLIAYLGEQPLAYRISLSHSKGQVLLVVSKELIEIGLDLEYIDKKREVSTLANNFFHQKEQVLVRDNDKTSFYYLWTLKEAFAKMSGQSVLSILPKDIRVALRHLATSTAIYHDYALAIVSSSVLNNNIVYILSCLELSPNVNE